MIYIDASDKSFLVVCDCGYRQTFSSRKSAINGRNRHLYYEGCTVKENGLHHLTMKVPKHAVKKR